MCKYITVHNHDILDFYSFYQPDETAAGNEPISKIVIPEAGTYL